MKKILVVEDSEPNVYLLGQTLRTNGYEVLVALKGKDALESLERQHIDLVLLDLILPDMSGHDVCKAIRVVDPNLPIIILSVKGDERDKVRALQAGADDYLAKPFSTLELLERIKVQFKHTRRFKVEPDTVRFIAGPLEVDFEQRLVKVHGQEIDLTYTEFELLNILVRNPGRYVTYDFILSNVWNDEDYSERKNIHVFINRLRKRIELPAGRRYIYNEPKVGYRFLVEE
ncbi:MAG TPA: response regulator transcription factor [Ktedonobacteraceae bacterium]|nr:response regulator transcription factor [Ktedonobacteraceae bacterium]